MAQKPMSNPLGTMVLSVFPLVTPFFLLFTFRLDSDRPFPELNEKDSQARNSPLKKQQYITNVIFKKSKGKAEKRHVTTN